MVKKLKAIKPLIIGLGVAGKRHLEAQLQFGFKVGVYSLNIGKTDPLRSQKNVIVFDNLKDAINWSNLVHVCTPDDLHTEFVALALKNDKTVLCEKSFTTKLGDAIYLQKLTHQHNCLLLVGQNYRLTPTFAETKKRIKAGDLGTLKKIKTTYLHDVNEYQKRTPSRKNEDFLFIGGSHAVDLACWIAGEPVIRIKAITSGLIKYKIDLEFVSGLLAEIILDASSPQQNSGTDLIVEGENGRLISHNKSDQLLYYKTDNQDPQSINLANNKTFTTLLEVEIVDKFLSNKKNSYWPLPDVNEALNTIKILDAVQKAISSGGNASVA